jgi:hypothetical protein
LASSTFLESFFSLDLAVVCFSSDFLDESTFLSSGLTFSFDFLSSYVLASVFLDLKSLLSTSALAH